MEAHVFPHVGVARAAHVDEHMCVRVRPVPRRIAVGKIKQASPLTPPLSLKSLIGPESLERSSLSVIVLMFFQPLFLLFSSPPFWLCRLAGWLAVGKGTSSPIVPGPREHSYKLNQCRM